MAAGGPRHGDSYHVTSVDDLSAVVLYEAVWVSMSDCSSGVQFYINQYYLTPLYSH